MRSGLRSQVESQSDAQDSAIGDECEAAGRAQVQEHRSQQRGNVQKGGASLLTKPADTAWLTWFADIALEAQRRTIGQVEFLIAKTKLLDRLRGHINQRQEKALLRMLREGPEGFKGGLSAGNYSTITGASPATTTRDLADLTERGALVRTGERKHARYALNLTGIGSGREEIHGGSPNSSQIGPRNSLLFRRRYG